MSFHELKIVRVYGWMKGNIILTKILYKDGHTEIETHVLKRKDGRMTRTA